MIRKRTNMNTIYQARQIDQTKYSDDVWFRKEKLDHYEILKLDQCSRDVIFIVIGVPKSTLLRWKKQYDDYGLIGLENMSRRPHKLRKRCWTDKIKRRIYLLRKKYPFLGKAKLAKLYEHLFNEKISISTVGRILKFLLAQGTITSVAFMCGLKKTKKRLFKGYAQPWNKTMKARIAGELIQIDHMTLYVDGIGTVKQFNATCPVTKWAVEKIYKQATSYHAAQFLQEVIDQMPFSIRSIQVDGGSEFMDVFEKSCQDLSIPLYVLPPRRPQYNGVVERCNKTFRYEFYALYEGDLSFDALQKNLAKFTHFYNKVRPHHSLGLLTPYRFYELMKVGDPVPYV